MIDAIGTYSGRIRGLEVRISAKKTVEIRFGESCAPLTDGVRYHITAEIVVEYQKSKGSRFYARVLTVTSEGTEGVADYARYKGVVRVREGAGGMKEDAGTLWFYRGDAFPKDLRKVELDAMSGWVTISVPNVVSNRPYSCGDLLYVDGKLYHKNREADGVPAYELCVRAEICHKVDGAEYWEMVRVAPRRRKIL
ncbi:hypothetical protein FACS1894208_00030 [Clostridia bacterium]|nr:hypothetical protein FACS1894208_00030 [Clostridia bacterium]